MAEEQPTDLLKELRRIRFVMVGIMLMLALLYLSASLDMWMKSHYATNTNPQELPAIQGELRGIRDELSLQRNPSPRVGPFQPVAIPGGFPPRGDAANTRQLLLGKWKHEKDNTVITLEFTADKLSYRNNRPDAGPPGETPYKVLDEKTLEMPKLGVAPLTEKVTIDSLLADKMALSGGESWKFDKTEFTKEK